MRRHRPPFALLRCLAVLCLSACGDAGDGDAGMDAAHLDAASLDAGMDAASLDAGSGDAGVDADLDDGATTDGGLDGAAGDGGPRCDPARGVECDGDWTGRCEPTCDPVSECCSPRDGRFACARRDALGRCPAADIWVDASRITDAYRFTWRYFDGASCSVEEACVSGTGWRRLLLFDTWTPNTGTADLYLGNPDTRPELFEYSPCHAHHHFDSYARYALLDGSGAVAASGHKQAFCLLDVYRYPEEDRRDLRYTCENQGIQRGYQDVYPSYLDCQWVDVTGVPPGDYALDIELNYERVLLERDYTNNGARVPVTVPDDDVTAACEASDPSGPERDCGWTAAPALDCTPFATVAIGCASDCALGVCTGDPALRVCDPAVGVSCGGAAVLAASDDHACGGAACEASGGGGCCPSVELTCPPSGRILAFTAPSEAGASATCELAVVER